MSSESDGRESPKNWTFVNSHGRTELSDDSSGSSSSSDFVDLGKDRVQYHHISRSSSAINVIPNTGTRPSTASSLPANFRAHIGASQDEHVETEGSASSVELPPYNTTLCPVRPAPDKSENKNTLSATGNLMSDLENLVSSSSTLVGSQSPVLLSSTGDLDSSGNRLEEAGDEEIEGAGHYPSVIIMADGAMDAEMENLPDEDDHPSCTASDTTSVDSIEVLSLPWNVGNQPMKAETLKYGWLDDEKDGKDEADSESVSQASVKAKAEGDPHYSGQSPVSSLGEDSDTSEFERIEVDMIPSLSEIENQANHSAEDDEDSKMDVAGARPIAQMDEQISTNHSSPRSVDKPQNYTEDQPVDQDGTCNFITDQSPSEQLPQLGLNIAPSAPPRVLNIRPLDSALVPDIQLSHQLVEGHSHPANSGFGAWPPVQPLNLPPDRFDLPGPLRQHRNSLSDDGFELIRRPRRQDDDSVSTISSSSSDISGFVNVRQRNAPSLSRSVSQHHSDFDDENLSNFTDGSEDCLPANMMIPSRKSGVRQYKHNRDEGFNATLDWLVFMVLITGLALGIGHFIGSSQEMAYQQSMNTGQVQRLRELQDDLVTCLDHSTGHNSKITTESSSPALQAIRLMEGLSSRMLTDKDLEQQLLLEQKVDQEQDTIRQGEPGDGLLHLAETDRRRPSEDKLEEGSILSFGEVGTGNKDVVMNPESSIDLHVSLSDDDGLLNEPVNGMKQTLLDVTKEDTNNLVVDLQPEKDFNDDEVGLSEDPDVSSISDQHNDESDERKDAQKMTNRNVLKVYTKSTEISILNEQHVNVEKDIVDDHSLERGLERDETNAAEVEIENDLQGKGEMEEDVKSIVNGDISPESSSTEHESATIKALKQKMEIMEERMDKVFQAAENWQQMFEDLKKDESSKDDEGQDTSHSSKSSDKANDDQTETAKDNLAGIAAALEHVLPGFLHSDHGNDFLAYLNRTEASVKSLFDSDDQDKSGSWSEAFYTKLEALKALSESDEVQTIVNNTKLFAEHLSLEIESVTGSLKNRSDWLVEEHNITVEGLGERANSAWTKLKNVTSDVLDYNKKILAGVGERLTDTLHTVENISAETIAKHNISLSNVGKMAEQVWGSVKNYSTIVTDGILNATTTGKSESEPSKVKIGFRQTVKDAWNTVKNYSNDFTKKQNLSISGLRDRVKAAWGKVKNSSAQVLDDISESNLAGKLQDGAKKLGEKVGTTFRSVKDKVKDKVKGFHKRKGRHGKKKHFRERSKHHRHDEIHVRNHFRRASGNAERDVHKGRHIHRCRKRLQHQHRERHHQSLDNEETIASFDEDHEHYEEEYLVPVQQHHQQPERDDDPVKVPRPDQDNSFSFSSPQRPQWVLPSHGDTKSVKRKVLKVETTSQIRLKEKHHSVPSRKQSIKSGDAMDQNRRDKTGQEIPRVKKMFPRRPFNIEDFPKFDCKGKEITEPKWDDIFDCMDMHCKGDEKCMQSQRKDAARLYSELLDYQDWLKDRHLKKDVRELKEFLEELGEFLSETDTDDEDLDELKDEFGEMVKDMEERAFKRQRKSHKKSQGQKLGNGKDTNDKDNSIDDETAENSTFVINFKSLPQRKLSQTDLSSESSPPKMERRKYAGRGYQNTDDQEDWYLQRAKDREDQRKSHESNPIKEDNFNWYLHWVQGRINGRTGVTVWDMYEWIKERYVLREELRRHEMEDHTNWFLRRP